MKYRIFIICISIVVLSGIVNAAPVQWHSGIGANGHWYEIVRAPADNLRMTWTEARDLAQSATFNGMQGHLVTLTSIEENNFVGNTDFLGASYNLLYGDNVWIGGFQSDKLDEPDGNWVWVTGETWNWTNWEAGSPDNGGAHHVQDFLKMGANQWNIGRWNDVDHVSGSGAGYGAAYIVEFEPSTVPAPGAFVLLVSGLISFVGLKRKYQQGTGF